MLRWQEAGYPYPADWGPAWKCASCDAYIRCYYGTVTPLGMLADADTRHWRHLAHRALDPLWQRGQESRSSVYRWLAEELGVSESEAHIGRMDPDGCRKVIAAVAGRRRRG
ncbi:hypothetical protein GCM10007164_20450 [Luteimonas padinae]|nr:hypothetical protein GCM10007164_20450 [Luteimonas padinae]